VPAAHGVEILNTTTAEVAESHIVGLNPTEGTLTPAADLLYLSDSAAGRVVPITVDTRHVGLPIQVGHGPGACRLDPSGELLLVVNHDSNDLAVIRVRPIPPSTTSSLLTMVPVGLRPTGLAVLRF